MQWHKKNQIILDEQSAEWLWNQLNIIDDSLTPHIAADKECFQLVLECRWLKSNLKERILRLPNWELFLYRAQRNGFANRYPFIAEPLEKVVSKLTKTSALLPEETAANDTLHKDNQ